MNCDNIWWWITCYQTGIPLCFLDQILSCAWTKGEISISFINDYSLIRPKRGEKKLWISLLWHRRKEMKSIFFIKKIKGVGNYLLENCTKGEIYNLRHIIPIKITFALFIIK